MNKMSIVIIDDIRYMLTESVDVYFNMDDFKPYVRENGLMYSTEFLIDLQRITGFSWEECKRKYDETLIAQGIDRTQKEE